jgi:hypothetical protein
VWEHDQEGRRVRNGEEGAAGQRRPDVGGEGARARTQTEGKRATTVEGCWRGYSGRKTPQITILKGEQTNHQFIGALGREGQSANTQRDGGGGGG